MSEQNPGQWRQLAWRRKLSEAEVAELRRILATDPLAREEFQGEAELNDLLERLPEAPTVASNFTSLVLQAVERDAKEAERERAKNFSGWRGWWHLLPKMAVVCLVIGFSLIGHHVIEANNRATLAREAVAISSALPANPEVVKDVEPIMLLTDTDSKADTELLALMK